MIPHLFVYHYYSGAVCELGVEAHTIEDVDAKVYSVAKTVVDRFRLRNKAGLDIALEALKEDWQSKRFTADELLLLVKISYCFGDSTTL